MEFVWNPSVIPLSIDLMISLVAGILLWRRSSQRSLRWFSIFLWSMCLWLIVYTIGLCAKTPEIKMVFYIFDVATWQGMLMFLLIFSISYVGLDTYYRFPLWLIYAAVPIVAIIFTITNPSVVWTRFSVVQVGDFYIRSIELNWMSYIRILYNYLLVCSCIVLYIQAIPNALPQHRRQIYVMILACVLPSLMMLLPILGIVPAVVYDILPVSFSITALLVCVMLFSFHIFPQLPIAYKLVFENMKDEILIVNMEGEVIESNRRAEEFLGREGQSLIGMNITEVFGEYTELLEAYESKPDEESNSVFYGLFNLKGALYEVRGNPIFSHSGVRMGEILILCDISLKRMTESRLIKSEERYRMISELTSDFAYLVSKRGDKIQIEWVLGSIEKITGYSSEEVSDPMNLMKAVHPDDMETVQRHIYRLKNNQISTAEIRIIRKDGRIRWMRDYAKPFWDEQKNLLDSVFGASKDITEQKNIQQALSASEQTLRGLFNASPNGIVVMNLNGKIFDCNMQFIKLFAAEDRSFMIGKNILELFHDTDHQKALRTVLNPVHNKLSKEVEFLFMRMDGGSFPGLLSCSLIEDVHGNPVYYIGVISDITVRKETEYEMKAFADKLNNAISDLQGFAFVVSYDLKEPIMALTSFINSAKKYTQQKYASDTEMNDYIRYIQEGINRIDHLMKGFVDYTQIPASDTPFSIVDFNQALTTAQMNLRGFIDERRAVIRTESLPQLPADYSQIVQLFKT